MLKEGVSIIVCCYNSAARITATLQHLAAQVTNNIKCEIIVVDNASTDETQKTVTLFWAEKGNPAMELMVVSEPKPGLSNARQTGMAQAMYNYLVFCDDDNWLAADYVSTVVNLFDKNANAAILGGYGTPVFDADAAKPIWFERFHSSYAVSLHPGVEADVQSVYGAGMALRKPVITHVLALHQLFLNDRQGNILLAGGDEEICLCVKLAGYQVIYSPTLQFKHYLPVSRLNWAYLKKLHTGFANSFVVLDLYYKALNTNTKHLPGLYWLKKALYYWGIYLKYWPKHRKNAANEGAADGLSHITWKNIAQGYIAINFKTAGIYKKIISLLAVS